MSTHKVYLLLGSNLGDRKKTLKNAKSLIDKEIGVIINQSEIIETEPVGFESEYLFMNQIIFLETQLSPMKLLQNTQSIEKRLGRSKKTKNDKYQDREVDIDILIYDELHYKSQKLDIPHIKNLEKRQFVKELFDKVL